MVQRLEQQISQRETEASRIRQQIDSLNKPTGPQNLVNMIDPKGTPVRVYANELEGVLEPRIQESGVTERNCDVRSTGKCFGVITKATR